MLDTLNPEPAVEAPPISPGTQIVRHLYVHVPFCAHKCEYCAFYSAPPSGDQVNRYVDAVVRELELIAPRCRPETIFFGGGTPSLLNLRQWETVLETMRRLGLLGAKEFSVECNPATVSEDKARLLRSAGVNRISMGVQSLEPALLERLGRIHSRDMVFRSYDTLRAAGFDSINIDLMFAIPGQTMEIWRRTLDEALALGTEHLSCYEVIYEEDTALYEQLKAGKFDLDEDLACAQYEALVDRSAEAGFQQYEVANFARNARVPGAPTTLPPGIDGPGMSDLPTFASRHNAAYWMGHDFFGLGPSASEYLDGVRSRNWSNTTLYCEQLERGRRSKEFAEALPPISRAGELAAFGLRMNAGWRYSEFEKRTGFDLRTEWAEDLRALEACGWAEIGAERFRLTRQGLRFADSAAVRMLRPEAVA